MVFDSGCRFDCPAGYEFNVTKSQSATRYCKVDGTWDGQYQVCKDVKPPSFTTCPSNRKFSYNTTFRTNTARVEWEVPQYEDNSILHDVNHKVTLVEVNGYKSPRDFEIGTHRAHYIVTDKAGLQAHCEFVIEVKDKEAPYYTGCPQRIEKEFVAQAPYHDKMRVTWEDPMFQDNSGKDPTSVPSSPNGAFFKEGQHQITYTATDLAGNKNASCQFEIKLKSPTCVLHKRPKNGALACQTIPSYQCQPLCREGYDFAYKPKYLYYCVNKIWMYWPPFPPAEAVWPDCARREDPTSGTLKMASTYYFKGDCNDKEVQAELKERYMKVVSDPMAFPLSFCKFNKDCKLENIQIFCGAVDASRRRRRRRRSLEMEFHIQADFTVKPSNAVASQQDFQNLKSEMKNVYYGEMKNNVNNVNWKNEMKMNLVKPPKVFAPEPYCSGERGAVVGRCDNIKHNCDSSIFPVDPACLCNYDIGNIEKCIECPIGKYYDASDRKCKLCSDGTYQDVEGQFGCKKCQPGFHTLGNDEKNFTSCKEICKPGYFSLTGLGPCRPCRLGYYSTDTWSTSCKMCPTGTTTVLPAASKIEECGMKCAPGTYSPSGVEPCKPCEKGSYQPEEGKLSCLPCKGKKSTYGPGAKSEVYCLDDPSRETAHLRV
ncbi:Hypothetical predicted protein [Paramuricea clavata]|uniref:Uncharacterized protein n=1 Tax=Paramuricea clavata TaxID=317549 RepID=A0A6S7I7Z6_PARCT|nr:Hypothetical predicted protein [Paramuricea clavata]